MKKIVIIGASISGHSVAMNLRQLDKDCSIQLVTENTSCLLDKRRLADLFSGKAKEKDLVLISEDLYKKEKIDFIKEAKVTAINTDKKLVFAKGCQPIEYDFLVISSGRRYVAPQFPGSRKEGAVSLGSLEDIRKFKSRLINDAVCVVGSTDTAVRVASAISSGNTEVKLLSDKEMCLDLPHVETINIPIVEIIGESDVQAVKLEGGKILSASAVIFVDTLKSNIGFLKNTKVAVSNDLVVVDESFKTSVADIFACGSVCIMNGMDYKEKTWAEAETEGSSLAGNLLNILRENKLKADAV